MAYLEVGNFDQPAATARHGAAQEKQIVLFIDRRNDEILDRDTIHAHVSGHAAARNDALESGRADGTRSAMTILLAVGLRTAAEIIALYDALESASLCDAAHAHLVAFLRMNQRRSRHQASTRKHPPSGSGDS